MTNTPSGSRRRRLLWVAGGLIAAFTIAGFFVAPPIIKAQIEKRASALLGRTVTVGRVAVNPYTVAVTIEQLDIRLKDGTGSFLGWDRLYVNADPLASLTGAWTLGAVELDGFHVTAEIRADGSFNFADIIAQLNAGAPAAPATAPAKPARPLRVGSLKVAGARLDFVDRTPKRPFTTSLGPVSFSLTEFVTAGARGAPYRFEAVTEAGEKFLWSGSLAADPVASRGEFAMENLLLKKYTPYADDKVRAQVTDGALSLRGRYEVEVAGALKTLKLTGGELHLRNLKVGEPGGSENALELPTLDITGIEADGLTRQASIGAVTLSGGQVRARREKDGTINLLALLQPPAESGPKAPPTSEPATAGTLPELRVGEVAVKDFSVELADLAAPTPAQLALKNLQVSVKDVTLADGAVMPLAISLNWSPRGAIDVRGTLALRPRVRADLKLDVGGVELLPLSPYLEQFVNARITQGAVSTQGNVQVELPTAGAPAISFAGGVTLEKFGLVDGALSEQLAGFRELALNGLKATTAPTLAVSLDEVKLTAPYARVVVAADKTLNLAAVAKSAPENEPSGQKAPATEQAMAGPRPKIEIARVVVSEGDFTFADRSVSPAVRVAVNQFGGSIAGLSSENFAKAKVDLRAAVDGTGPIAITGELDPLGAKKFVDLKVDVQHVDLVPLSPYSGKFAGYELARGKLNVAVQARLDGEQLDATNLVTLNQFTFGAPVESPEATKLPVRLGVALLKDLDGKIVIDVPVSGRLDDPSFGVGRVVLRVITNLLAKAAVSPFALLGSMFGGGGDELAFQEFAPGASALQATEVKKLATMVQALTNRPGLSVAIEGGYDGPADTYALKRRKLDALVRAKIWEERRAVDPNLPPPEQLEIAAEASAAKVKQLFDEKFPPGTQFGAPLPPAPVAAAAPPAPKKGLLRRVVDVVTFRGSGATTATAAETKAATPAAVATEATGGPSLEEMTGRLAETMAVTDDDLRALAATRAQAVRDYFINAGKIAPDRVFLAKGKEQPENKGPRVLLGLQ